MKAVTEGSLPPVMPQGNLVEVLGREVRQGLPGELMVESTPSRRRRPPCKTNKEESDEAADAAALTYFLTPPGLAQRPCPLALPPAQPATATARAPTQAAAQVTAQTADAREWGRELSPPTHAPPTIRHDGAARATSRGREGGDNEREGGTYRPAAR